MKKIFILTLLFSVAASGRTQAAKRIPNVPIAGITKTLSEYRSDIVDYDLHLAAKQILKDYEAEEIMQSIEKYQERQEKEAERMMRQGDLSIEQVLIDEVGSVE